MDAKKEILVYQNLPKTRYRWVMLVSYIQAFFLVANLWVMPSPRLIRERDEATLKKLKEKKKAESESSDEDSRATRKPVAGFIAEEKVSIMDAFTAYKMKDILSPENLLDNLKERPIQSLLFTGFSVSAVGFLWLYTSRLAHKIILLPNEKARFVFFSPLARKQLPTKEIDLRNVACIAPRESKNNYSILKFRDTLGYYLVNKKDGQFLEPKLYDDNLGFQRSWYKK